MCCSMDPLCGTIFSTIWYAMEYGMRETMENTSVWHICNWRPRESIDFYGSCIQICTYVLCSAGKMKSTDLSYRRRCSSSTGWTVRRVYLQQCDRKLTSTLWPWCRLTKHVIAKALQAYDQDE